MGERFPVPRAAGGWWAKKMDEEKSKKILTEKLEAIRRRTGPKKIFVAVFLFAPAKNVVFAARHQHKEAIMRTIKAKAEVESSREPKCAQKSAKRMEAEDIPLCFECARKRRGLTQLALFRCSQCGAETWR